VDIESIRHKALKRLATKGDRRIMEADRLIDMLAFMVAAPDLDALYTPPNFGFHALTGDRKGSYAMIVTKNWRLSFAVQAGALTDLNLEDYHGD
jgi:proteic killer suppression protein